MKIITNTQLDGFLKSKLKAEQGVEEIIKKQNFRFSRKKFVGDLGEYYFMENVKFLFKKIEQSKTSNKGYDFTGIFKDKYAKQYGFKIDKELQIEVKTRYEQKGDNHIFSLKKEKFVILAFVKLSIDYKCTYIGLLKSKFINTDGQNRIVFGKSYQEKVFWQSNEYK